MKKNNKKSSFYKLKRRVKKLEKYLDIKFKYEKCLT